MSNTAQGAANESQAGYGYYSGVEFDTRRGYGGFNGGGAAGGVLEFNRILGTIRRRKYFILLIILLINSISVFALYQIKPTFMGEANVIVEPARQNIVDIEEVMEDLSTDLYTVRTEAAVIESRVLIEQVITDMGLPTNAYYQQLIGVRAPPADLDGAVSDTDAPPVSISTDRIVDAFLAHLDAVPESNSRMIKIQFQSSDPQFAADAANAVANGYIQEQLEAKSSATEFAGNWLSTRVEELRGRLLDSEIRLEEFKRDSGIVDVKGGTIYSEQLAQLNMKLIEARNSRAEAQARVEQVQNLINSAQGVETAASVLSSSLIQELREQESMVTRKIGELRTLYREEHPKLKLALAELTDLRAKIRDEVNKIVISLNNELELANEREQNLEMEILNLRKLLEEEKESAVTLRSLQSEVNANKQLYDVILSRFKETGVQDEGAYTPDAKLISFATVPTSPFKPNRQLIIIASIFISIVIAISASILIEFSMTGYHSGLQIEHDLGTPVLAMLPQIDGNKKDEMPHMSLLQLSHHPLYSESVRNLRSALIDNAVAGDPKVIVVTSSVPDEGKTSTVFSLATISRLLNQKCLLIDCDLRRSKLAKRLEIQTSAGLGDYLSETAELRDVLYKDNKSGVYFIPAGKSLQHPLDLLATRRMQRFVEGLRSRFDYIFIDAPPLLSVSDAIILSKYADYALYVVRWENTSRSAVSHGIKQLREKAQMEPGVVLSRVDVNKHAYYHYTDSDYIYFKNYSFNPSS